MTHFPKALVSEAMQSKSPESYIPQLLNYTRTHLTCRAMAQYVFDTVGCPTPKRVLFLGTDPRPDYLRCLTLIGMKQILGANCVDSVHVPHIYEDYPTPTDLYGRGFTYTRILPVFAKSPLVHIDELRNHAFDLVVYGSVHRGLPHWDIVTSVYKPSEIVLMCGEDICVNCPSRAHPEMQAFVREQTNSIVVQIGTNNGLDHVRDLCLRESPIAVYLVEPFSVHNSDIRKNYSGIANVCLENIAITPTPQDTVELFYTEQDGPANDPTKSYQVASIKPEHIVKHAYDPTMLQSVVVPAMTLNAFFAKHNLHNIDYLFLDIEGIDFEVLRSIDFSRYTIRHLQIEHLHLDYTELISFMYSRGYEPIPGLDKHRFDTAFLHVLG